MHPHLMYFEKQQEKERKMQRANQIALINQNLKQILQKLQGFIEREKYEKEVRILSRPVASASIWDITYRNNMENPDVAISQGVLIYTILQKEGEKIPNGKYLIQELERFMRQLGNIEWSYYMKYNQLKNNRTRY